MGFLLCVVAFICAAAYAYKVVGKPQKYRKHKTILLLPLLPLFLYLPWLPSSCHIRTLLAIVLLWTAPSKLLLLSLDISLDPFYWLSSSFSHFLVAVFLPIRISSIAPAPYSLTSTRSAGYGALIKLPLLIAILNVYPLLNSWPIPLLYLLYCCHFYLGLELFLNATAGMVSRCFSVRLCPQFDDPLSSASLSEFWGRRWNLTVNSVLKETVYKPVLKGLSSTRSFRSPWSVDASKAVAMLATFATSGVLHELIFVYVSQSAATGEMTAFFVLHGLATVGEVAAARRGWRTRGVPTWIRRALTGVFLYATASVFFLDPLRRAGTDMAAIAEYHRLQSAFLSFVFRTLSPLLYTSSSRTN